MISSPGKKIQIICSLVILFVVTLMPPVGISDSPAQGFVTPCVASDNSSKNLSTDELATSGEFDEGKDSNKASASRTIYVPGDFSTIQEAVDEAEAFDTIMVSGGPYYECVNIGEEGLKLIGTDYPEINASNCGGHAVSIGPWSDGCLIQGFKLTGASGMYHAGVKASSDDNTIKNNILADNFSGIDLHSSNNIITGNQINNNWWGINVENCQGNEIQDNDFSNKRLGIILEDSSGNKIANNEFTGDGLIVYDSYPNTVEGNTVNGKPLVYLQDKSDIVVPSPAGQVICINCTNITIQDQDLSNTSVGVELVNTQNVVIRGNNMSNGENGILLRKANNTEIKDNTISDNDNCGLFLRDSNNNTIYNNYISNSVNVSYRDNGQNTWNIEKTEGGNIVGGPYLGGNYWGGKGYWGAYTGRDTDGDGLGDTNLPYNCQGNIVNGGDYHPLIEVRIGLKASKERYTEEEQKIDNSENFGRIDISGMVTDKVTGEPIEDATVEITGAANPDSTTTGADGTYTITAVVPGGSGSDTRENVDFELTPSEYIVGVHEITSEVIELIEENNGTIIDQCQYENGPQALLVNISEEEDIEDFINNVGSSALVKYVELNGVDYTYYIPNDPRYPDQWGPPNIHAGGLPNPSAWDVETGGRNVTIAIVDTGIQYDHVDLYRFSDETIKYVYGYDWVDMDDDPSPERVQERHGTHVTGIATAVMDNLTGIAGIAPDCSFIAERAMRMVWVPALGQWRGRGRVWDTSRGIMDAADHDADIINMSFGGRDHQFRRDATLYASTLGCILVAAAGNAGQEGVIYPAAYPWVIAVGATNQQDLRAPFSNWGVELDLVAPGVNILSTVPWNAYDYIGGTSMAAPHVAGVAALVKSRAERWPEEPLATDPWYHLNNNQIHQVLLQSAIDLGSPGWDKEYGYGKVDAARALRCVEISGNVLESVFNVPIPLVPGGPEVRVESIEGPPGTYSTNENTAIAQINEDGEYCVRVPPGVYRVCAMAYGYIPSRGFGGERVELPAFDLMGNLTKDYRELRLVPFPCEVTGNVTDSQTGMPIDNASVSLDGPPHIYPPHPNVHMESETDPDGSYKFILEYSVHPPYPTGEATYYITVDKPGYQTQTQSFTLDWSVVVANYYKCPLDPDDYDPPIVDFALLSGTSEPPELTVTPTSFDVTLSSNTSQDYGLTIRNDGGSTLIYYIRDRETTGGSSTARIASLLPKPACEILEVPLEGKALKEENSGEAETGWQNIMTEYFEGEFPAGWDIRRGDTDAYWGRDDHERHGGSYSAFCAKSGMAGVDPPENYPNNMSTWMVYGPFSLADATGAELNFWYWLDTQIDHDYLKWMASTNGENYYGRKHSGNSQGWVSKSFDLTDVYTLGNLCGEPEVWIAFIFTSDESITDKGAFIDDVVLRKYVPSVNNPPNPPSEPSPADHATGVSINADLSWTGGDPDAGDVVTYDVYFGTSASPPMVSDGQSVTTYDPGTLNNNARYYWKVVATDNHAASTSGPVWQFTTGDCPWLDENPKSGLVEPGNSDFITITVDATGLASDCSAEVVIANNDADENPTIVPVTLHVSDEWDPWEYDENSDGEIDKMEAIQAVMDYFDGEIDKMKAIEVIMLYFE